MAVRLGKQTIALEAPVSIVNTATVVGTKERGAVGSIF